MTPDPAASAVTIAPIGTEDLGEVLALNEANVPEVGRVQLERLAELVAMSSLAVAARDASGALAGFVIVLPEDAPYSSPNFGWFRERRRGFVYLDRIAVAESARGRGIGRMLHEATLHHARQVGATEVALEVNVEPPNPRSMGFHQALGFEPVGELAHRFDYVVAMLVRPVTPS